MTAWTDAECPVARTLDLVGDRWSLLIVRDAFDGATSFSEFHRTLGVARNILSDRLRRLVDVGVLARVTAPSGKRQEYRLTESGSALFTVIVALRQWGEQNAFGADEAHSTLVATDEGMVAPLTVTRQDGTALAAVDTYVRKPG